MNRRFLVAFLLALACSTTCLSQSTIVNKTTLFQTRLIATKQNIGTAFVIEVDKREYWITAKHLFASTENAPPGVVTTKTVEVNLLYPYSRASTGQEQTWRTVKFATIDPGKDIDILVLVPPSALTPLLPDDSMKPADNGDPADEHALVPIGGDCEFVGYPYGGGWKANAPASKANKAAKSSSPAAAWFWSPFVKRCTLSGSRVRNGVTIFVLDGINNLGFSGGPVITGKGTSQAVFAVVSGFHPEPLEVLPAPEHAQPFQTPISPLAGQKSKPGTKQIVESNSGLIFAYDITPAIKAIRANPIGPLHTGLEQK